MASIFRIFRENRVGAQGKWSFVFPVVVMGAALLLFAACAYSGEAVVVRIRDWETGAVYAELPGAEGSELFFGWIHSLEKIPWNEYYHIGSSLDIVLDAITFPAFGAGIPENKGRVCYVKDGLIHMEEIDQVFHELVWLNSRTATQEIRLDGKNLARGSELPHHVRLRLLVERGDVNGP